MSPAKERLELTHVYSVFGLLAVFLFLSLLLRDLMEIWGYQMSS